MCIRDSTWILNKIVRTFQVMVFLIAAFILTGQYVISIFSMILMMFLLDFVILSLSTDNVEYSQKPDDWDLSGLIKVAVPLGLIIMIEGEYLDRADGHYQIYNKLENTYAKLDVGPEDAFKLVYEIRT